MIFRRISVPVILLGYLLLQGCGPSMALFSERAYDLATSLKVETLALMDKAVEPYDKHAAKVEDLILELRKAYEYAAGRASNEIPAEQWAILIDPEKNLAGGFFKRWQEKGTLNKIFIDEAKKGLIAPAFDLIIGLEAGKLKPEEARIIGE
jgi:hypothetical protein